MPRLLPISRLELIRRLISVDLLIRLLKQAEISKEDWINYNK